MKENELRIGNIVFSCNKEEKTLKGVLHVYIDGDIPVVFYKDGEQGYLWELEPVPLTDEILTKVCGFGSDAN